MASIELAESFRQANYSELYFKSILAVKYIKMLLLSKTSILAIGTVFVFLVITVIIVNILHFVSEYKKDFTPSEKDNDSTSLGWNFINDHIIEDNEKVLEELHQATDRCYNKRFALKCIELSKYCPHLINLCLPNSNGITPFHRVCYRGNYCLIDFMIDNGADLSQKTDSGETAFHMVIDYYIRNSTRRKFKCLDLLYKKGCYLKKNSGWYKTFVSDAKKAKNEDLVQWLASHSTPVKKKSGR